MLKSNLLEVKRLFSEAVVGLGWDTAGKVTTNEYKGLSAVYCVLCLFTRSLHGWAVIMIRNTS
jgi:hypothetical protein